MPDFGSFRGFGEKLTQGQTPTQLGKIGSESAYDGDANSFFQRVTSAGGTLSNTEKIAVNQLVLQMKADGTWTPMKAIYPMVGASAAACAQNLKSSSFTGTFSSGWTFSSTGITPNGTNAYMSTNIIPSTNLKQDSVHVSNYLPNFITETNAQIGSSNASPPNKALYMFYRYDASLGSILCVNSSINTFVSIDQTTNSGMRIVTRTSSTITKSYVNNTNNYTSNLLSSGLSDFEIVLAARNVAGNKINYSANKQSFASIGDGLTDTQVSNFYTAVQAFQTTLGRQV
jgi:hypothetical protein